MSGDAPPAATSLTAGRLTWCVTCGRGSARYWAALQRFPGGSDPAHRL